MITPLAVLAVTAALAVPSALAQSGQEALLEDAERRIDAVEQRLAAAASRAEDAQLELAEAQERMDELEAVVNDVARRLRQQQQSVEQAAAELARLEREAADRRDAVTKRVKTLFKSGGGGRSMEMLLASGDIQDVVDRGAFIRLLNRGDLTAIEAAETGQVAVAAQRRRLAAESRRLEQLKEEQEALLARVRQVRENRALAAAQAAAEVEELEDRREHLEEDQERLEELIRANQATPASVALPSTSGYVWPACGRVTSEYGYRWGRLHAGIDIDDNNGSAIGAAKAGVVIYADWRGGYGRLTLIDHGDGVVTAYAHQREQVVGAGERVERGQRIGTIGTTGASTGTHLHFETRVNGSAVNPRRFLPASC